MTTLIPPYVVNNFERTDDLFVRRVAYKNKLLRPSKQEIIKNSRSRSAKLRFAIRSKNKFEYPLDLKKKFKKYLDIEAINA